MAKAHRSSFQSNRFDKPYQGPPGPTRGSKVVRLVLLGGLVVGLIWLFSYLWSMGRPGYRSHRGPRIIPIPGLFGGGGSRPAPAPSTTGGSSRGGFGGTGVSGGPSGGIGA